MSLLKKFHDTNKQACKNAPLLGTGMGGSFLLDAVLDRATQPYVDVGKRAGYAEASDEYEEKLLNQADLFIQQLKDAKKERDEYEQLLDAYEQEIEILTAKVDRTEAENKMLQELLIRERQLKKL